MPELLLELFSEEIPARMQARAADDLARLLGEALAPIVPAAVRTYSGPRRIALVAQVAAEVPATRVSERGPRVSAPEQALAGFLRKHRAAREQLVPEGDYWVLERATQGQGAAELIARALPPLLWRFPWPKSMRWGEGSNFTWVRPLRRILCILDGEIVPFALRQGEDDAHGLRSGNATEGHRFHAPGAFVVQSAIQWQEKLRERRVIVDAVERRHVIETGLARALAERGLTVVEDAGLLDEIAGLVEWPVVHVGEIDPSFMDLPPEVMQVSMRVNQKYFALRRADGGAAPAFAFAANLEAADGGHAIVAGNERVLRARFADARHFWDSDRRKTMESRVPLLDKVTFHAKLGSQGDRVRRLVALAGAIAPLVGAHEEQAGRAALLCKADLVTGTVSEFPELQGVIGGYFARLDGEPDAVAGAIRDHYAPKGPADATPDAPVSITVALADKLDQLAGFFAVGEIPTGSGDPYALRRAALGVIRLIRNNGVHLRLDQILDTSLTPFAGVRPTDEVRDEIFAFLLDRLRIALRQEGRRHDVLASVLSLVGEYDLIELVRRADAVDAMLDSDDGASLLAGYKRAVNILSLDNRVARGGTIDMTRLEAPEEVQLAKQIAHVGEKSAALLRARSYSEAMAVLATLRPPIDAFFENVTVHVDDSYLRANRENILAAVRNQMNTVADFSKIEG